MPILTEKKSFFGHTCEVLLVGNEKSFLEHISKLLYLYRFLSNYL